MTPLKTLHKSNLQHQKNLLVSSPDCHLASDSDSEIVCTLHLYYYTIGGIFHLAANFWPSTWLPLTTLQLLHHMRVGIVNLMSIIVITIRMIVIMRKIIVITRRIIVIIKTATSVNIVKPHQRQQWRDAKSGFGVETVGMATNTATTSKICNTSKNPLKN